MIQTTSPVWKGTIAANEIPAVTVVFAAPDPMVLLLSLYIHCLSCIRGSPPTWRDGTVRYYLIVPSTTIAMVSMSSLIG